MSDQDDHNLRAPSLRNALSFISQTGTCPESNLHTAGAITAVSLQTAEQAEILINELDSRPHELYPSVLNMPSLASNFGSITSSNDCSLTEDTHDDYQLPDIFNNLMKNTNHGLFYGHNILTEDEAAFDAEFLRTRVLDDKLGTNFKAKLKHFFILSSAGKPIYSLNGNDDVLIGYMGLITTIIASFQESMKLEVASISLNLLKIVVKNKHPIILVAISGISHEITPAAPGNASILENQLECLYTYLLAVISKAVISRHFEAGMNYDLRRILTFQDLNALDTLAMKLTYGFHSDENNSLVIDAAHCFGAIFGNAMRCARISNTCRTKLSDILLSVKSLKAPREDSDFVSSISGRLSVSEHEFHLAADLLFGFITIDDMVISHLRPRNHRLQSRDISILLYIIRMNSESLFKGKDADLWIPLCMPEFNSSGFLYCYVKTFLLGSYHRPLTIILVSGNKNSFFCMKEAANYVITKIKKLGLYSKRLGFELSLMNDKKLVLSELKIASIKHFVYKRKEFNQIFVENGTPEIGLPDIMKLRSSLQKISLYSNLVASKGDEKHTKRIKSKKLTYTRLRTENSFITGFFLTDENYEFFCLCEGSISSQAIIDESLRIIHWCDRNRKRLFVGTGICF